MSLREPLEASDLLDEFPRSGWLKLSQGERTSRLLLARHNGFQTRIALLMKASEDALKGKESPPDFTYLLARELHYFVPLLEGHHQAETARLYPRLIEQYPPLRDKFGILEQDHTQLDSALNALSQVPQYLMGQASTLARFNQEVERLCERLYRFQGLLERHLEDEEDLVIPILLKNSLSLDL